jgi:hypothetical protein
LVEPDGLEVAGVQAPEDEREGFGLQALHARNAILRARNVGGVVIGER